MMPQLLCVLAMLTVASLDATNFDYDSYTLTSLDEILDHPPAITEGMDIFFKKRQFEATLEAAPEQCTAIIVGRVLKMQGINAAPEVNYCASLRSAKGRVVKIFVQNVLVSAMKNELAPGQRGRFWVVLLYYNSVSKSYGFLLNEFEAESAGKTNPASNDGMQPIAAARARLMPDR